LPATNGKTIKLSELKGKNVVLYFYPKDCTSGCTQEGQDFRDSYKKFTALDTVILGVSRDNLKLHEKFKTAEKFPFELISDIEEKLCKAYDVIKDKIMYGKKVRGIERSTFLIDKNGVLKKEWRKVKVAGHVEEVLEAVKSF
jgi:peroxiredoxin Q/BCP